MKQWISLLVSGGFLFMFPHPFSEGCAVVVVWEEVALEIPQIYEECSYE